MRLILRSCRFRAIVFLLLAAPAFPQGLTETIDVSIINMDVFVTDRRGNRVHGLTRDDFEIRENGKRQPITNFTEYAPRIAGTFAVEGTAAAQATPQPETTSVPAAKRTIVIFVEIARMPSERVRELFAGLREFIRTAVRPGDAVSVMAFRQQLATEQKFTDDVAALNAALAKLENESIGAATNVRDTMRAARADDEGAAAALQNLGHAAVGDRISVEALERKAAVASETSLLRRKTAAMTLVMESIAGAEGRKIMVLALQRYGLRPGFEHNAERSVPLLSLDPFVERLRQAVMRTANTHGITLYPLYTPGYRWGSNGDAQEVRVISAWSVDSDDDLARFGSDNAVLLNQTASLEEIAKETGGLMAAGPADIVALLPRIADDLESYYSLAYRATTNRDGERRKVVVTAKNRDYLVRSRRAVVEKSSDTQMDDRVVANLFLPFADSKIPIRVETGAMKKDGRRKWSLPVVVRVPLGALATLERDGLAVGSFTVFIATGGETGTLSDVVRRTQQYSVKLAELEAARRGDFTFNATIEIDHEPDAISIGVRDDVSQEYGLVLAAVP